MKRKLQSLATLAKRTGAAIALAPLTAGLALADGPDFSSLTSAVDFTTVGVAILAIAAVKAGPQVVMWGARKVLSFIR